MKDLKYYLHKAMKEDFSLGAFNFFNMESLQGITQACKETNSPAIIAVSQSALSYMGDFVTGLGEQAKKIHPALFLHLDHGKSFDACKKAIDLGFDSVMIDASDLPFEENIALTKQVCDYAHAHNVLVEAELGQIKGQEDNIFAAKDVFTSPIKAKEFVEKTGVDSLAISIGTSHGIYKNGGSALRFDILSEIEKFIPNTPLVLHGASTVDDCLTTEFELHGGHIKKSQGISKEEIIKATKHNIAKINTDTDLRLALACGIREVFNTDNSVFDGRKYLGRGREKVTTIVKDKIQNLFSSNNKI